MAHDYTVIWEIDAEGFDTPEEAARWAWEQMRRSDSTANVFQVIAKDGTDTKVDLQEVEETETSAPGKQLWDNHYECPCGEEWTDRWSATCDDDCPKCGTTCSPSSSEEVEAEDA